MEGDVEQRPHAVAAFVGELHPGRPRGYAFPHRKSQHHPKRPLPAVSAARYGAPHGIFQDPPELGNQFAEDPTLSSYLARALPEEVRRRVEPELRELGELAGGELYPMQLEDRCNEPVLTQWDAWGKRVDRIEVSPLWKRAAQIAAEKGMVATAYERDGALLTRPPVRARLPPRPVARRLLVPARDDRRRRADAARRTATRR